MASSILSQIYKQGETVVDGLQDMNLALKVMRDKDKQEYSADAKQRKYDREQDKRNAQDQHKFQKKVFDTAAGEANAAKKGEGTKKLAAGLSVAIAGAIKGAIAKSKGEPEPGTPALGMGGGTRGMFTPPKKEEDDTKPKVSFIKKSLDPMSGKSSTKKIAPKPDETLEQRIRDLEESVFTFTPKVNQQAAIKYQSGGFAGAVPDLGQPTTGDHFYTHVQPGSYILNRNAVAALSGYQGGGTVPVALEQGEIALPPGTYDQGMMDYLNYDAFPRFQRGGFRGSDNVINTGRVDYKGRFVKLSPEAAKAFEQMIKDGMPYHPHDVKNVYRDEKEYNRLLKEGLGPAANSKHNYGNAMDVHGITGEWIRKNGGKYGWKPNDYSGTHGGHYEFAKPNGAGEPVGGASNVSPQPGTAAPAPSTWQESMFDGQANTPAGTGKPEEERSTTPSASGMPGHTPTASEQPGVQGRDTGVESSEPTQRGPGGFAFLSALGPVGQVMAQAFSAVDSEVFGGSDFSLGRMFSLMMGGPGLVMEGFSNFNDFLANQLFGGPANAATNPNSAVDQIQGAQVPGAPGATAPSGGSGPATSASVDNPNAKALLNAIARAEGTTKSYGTMFAGSVNADLASGKLTVRQAIAAGDRNAKRHGSGATGRYQFMPQTLEGLVRNGTLKMDEKFTPRRQDEAALALVAGRGVNINDGLSMKEIQKLSWEWASIKGNNYTFGGRPQGYVNQKDFMKWYTKSGGKPQGRRAGGRVGQMKGRMDSTLQNFYEQNEIHNDRIANADVIPPVVQMGGGGSAEQPVVTTTSGSNLPEFDIPIRDSCPLSIYYRFEPSFNPNGMGAQ